MNPSYLLIRLILSNSVKLNSPTVLGKILKLAVLMLISKHSTMNKFLFLQCHLQQLIFHHPVPFV